jgi:hypothetical protein
MKCPACDHELTAKNVKEIEVDACEGGCGGVWFDNRELSKVDEPHETAGEELLDIETDPSIEVDHEKKRLCPVCPGIPLMRHFFSIKERVEVDECPSCGGYWIDFGELAAIRRQYKTEEERRQAAEDKFAGMLSVEFAGMQARSEKRLEKSKSIARMFKFLLPSYYIPGDQDWGAY